jgi:hypothetical protein
MSLLLCWFLDADNAKRSAGSTGRRPKTAKARSRGQLGTGWQRARDVDLMMALISILGRTPARRHLQVWSQARTDEWDRHFGWCSEWMKVRAAH